MSADAGQGGYAPDLEEKRAFLQRCAAYPERTTDVEVVETHMSLVFLTDAYAWKLKKPVRYDGLDFRSPELRRHDCQEEVRLNRRLTSGVYLGVAALRLSRGGALVLDPSGGADAQAPAVDWLVRMRRLPAERMLDVLIEERKVQRHEVRAAAERLARFYADAPAVEWSVADYHAHLRDGMEDDLRELLRPAFGLDPGRVRWLVEAQRAFLDAAVLERRVREGHLVEGHGDLRPEHVCLVDEPAIIDCLEFSRRLRIADPADELAFLGLECERLGEPAVGRWFLETWTAVSGDAPPEPLLRFHRTYRALRRAKLAVWHLDDETVRDRDKWLARACRYLELATPPH